MGSVAPCRGAVKMEVSMKLLFVIALCSLILPSQQTCPANCNTDARMVKVKCTASECVCEDNAVDEQNTVTGCETITAHDFSTDSFAAFDQNTCRTICQESNLIEDNSCKYWKFTEGLVWEQGEKNCYIMNKDQCDDHSGYCTHGDDPNPHGCVTGCVGPDDTNPTFTCPTGTVRHEGDLANNYLTWICFGSDDSNVDIYDENVEAPAGTHCFSAPECSKYQNLEYACVVDDTDPSGNTGKWGGVVDDSNDEFALEDGKLKEPTCNADDLPLEAGWQQPGMEIYCNDGMAGPVADNTVKAENHCLLLCDYYNVLSFYSRGQDGWFYKYAVGSDLSEKTLDENNVNEIIKCWG